MQQENSRPTEQLTSDDHVIVKDLPTSVGDSKQEESTVYLAGVKFEGASAISLTDLDSLVAPYLNKNVTFHELRLMAAQVERLYVQRGFLAVRALIPVQKMQDGVLTLNIIEGRFDAPKVVVQEEDEFEPVSAIVEKAICHTSCEVAPYVTEERVDRAMYLLNSLPGVSATATLKAGEIEGTTSMEIAVDSVQRVTGNVEMNNSGNTYTGVNQLSGGLAFNSALMLGDQLNVAAVMSSDALEHGTGLQEFSVGYSALADVTGTRFGIEFERLNYTLNGVFAALEVEGYSNSYSAWVSHPMWLSRHGRLEAKVGYEYDEFSDQLLGILDRRRNTSVGVLDLLGYRFWPGTSIGFQLKSSYGHLQYEDPTDKSIDSQTRKSEGQFFKQRLTGYFQHLVMPQWAIYGSLNAQWTNRNLDSSQALFLGGPSAVRAFVMDGSAVDQGVQSTLELRHQRMLGEFLTTFGAFYDRGDGMVNRHGWTSSPTSYSHLHMEGAGAYVGIGLFKGANLRVTYARRLSDNLITPPDSSQLWASLTYSF